MWSACDNDNYIDNPCNCFFVMIDVNYDDEQFAVFDDEPTEFDVRSSGEEPLDSYYDFG